MATYKLIGQRFLRKYTADESTPVYAASTDAQKIVNSLCKLPWERSKVASAEMTSHQNDEGLDKNVERREHFDAALFCAHHEDGRHRAYANAAVYRFVLPTGAALPNLSRLVASITSDPYNSAGARVAILTNSTGEIPMDCATCRAGDAHLEGVAPRTVRTVSGTDYWYPTTADAAFTGLSLQLQKYLFVFVLMESYSTVRGNWLEGCSYATENLFEIETDAAVSGWTDGATIDCRGVRESYRAVRVLSTDELTTHCGSFDCHLLFSHIGDGQESAVYVDGVRSPLGHKFDRILYFKGSYYATERVERTGGTVDIVLYRGDGTSFDTPDRYPRYENVTVGPSDTDANKRLSEFGALEASEEVLCFYKSSFVIDETDRLASANPYVTINGAVWRRVLDDASSPMTNARPTVCAGARTDITIYNRNAHLLDTVTTDGIVFEQYENDCCIYDPSSLCENTFTKVNLTSNIFGYFQGYYLSLKNETLYGSSADRPLYSSDAVAANVASCCIAGGHLYVVGTDGSVKVSDDAVNLSATDIDLALSEGDVGRCYFSAHGGKVLALSYRFSGSGTSYTVSYSFMVSADGTHFTTVSSGSFNASSVYTSCTSVDDGRIVMSYQDAGMIFVFDGSRVCTPSVHAYFGYGGVPGLNACNLVGPAMIIRSSDKDINLGACCHVVGADHIDILEDDAGNPVRGAVVVNEHFSEVGHIKLHPHKQVTCNGEPVLCTGLVGNEWVSASGDAAHPLSIYNNPYDWYHSFYHLEKVYFDD